MDTKMFIEGDGETDTYGLRIRRKGVSFVVQDLTREEMNYCLKDLVDQFVSLISCFDEMRNSNVTEYPK